MNGAFLFMTNIYLENAAKIINNIHQLGETINNSIIKEYGQSKNSLIHKNIKSAVNLKG